MRRAETSRLSIASISARLGVAAVVAWRVTETLVVAVAQRNARDGDAFGQNDGKAAVESTARAGDDKDGFVAGSGLGKDHRGPGMVSLSTVTSGVTPVRAQTPRAMAAKSSSPSRVIRCEQPRAMALATA